MTLHGPDDLLAHLAPMFEACARLLATAEGPGDEARIEAALRARFPDDGPLLRPLPEALRRGVADGWLCDRGAPPARFSRIAKPGPATANLSVDVVHLTGTGLRHAHPRGEITYGVADEASDPAAVRFDGRGPGFQVRGPGSVHTPTVTGGGMILLYVLPGGAIDWTPAT